MTTNFHISDYHPYGKVLREFQDGDKERYLTTQHERDQSTGLDYRGARFYDSDVGRFLSLDPASREYPSLSDYVYVVGNPIMLIDPDGKRIKWGVKGKEKRQLKRAVRDLRKGSETFQSMYTDLKNSENTYTYTTTDVMDGDGHTDGTISINLNGNSLDIPLEADIGHETGHAWRAEMGLDDFAGNNPYEVGTPEGFAYTQKSKIKIEQEGLHIENVVRAEMGMELREEYGKIRDYIPSVATKTIGFGGMEFVSLNIENAPMYMVSKDESYDYESYDYESTEDHYQKLKDRKIETVNIHEYER